MFVNDNITENDSVSTFYGIDNNIIRVPSSAQGFH